MWIPYDLMGALKAETPAPSVEASKADRAPRDIVIGFFVRNPVTQTWEIDVRAEAVNRVYFRDVQGMPAEIAFYGDESGKLNEIIYRVQGGDPFAALAACRRDVDERLARWALELGRGMALAGWRVADPRHGARWRCTPFRPSALDIDLDAVEHVPDDLRPFIRLYQRARNASDSAWRLLNATAILRPWREGRAPFAAAAARAGRAVTFDMLVHSGAVSAFADLRDRPLTELADRAQALSDRVRSDLDRPDATVDDEEARARLAPMASLADLAAREVLLAEIARRQGEAMALAS
ncbi:methylamine utilization protein MauJ [Methylopila musalis]|uniref:Methylamine utilization protein MauJ n=1 Tax=Methylopila musalis TaxID=1134781 RepID=A0ABW3Z3U2_9HYPH